MHVGTKALVGLAAGLAAGLAIAVSGRPALAAVGPAADAIGTLWINAILMTILPLVVSKLPPGRFAKTLTDPSSPVHAPRIFFADLRVDHDEKGRLAGWLPYANPMHLEDCIQELEHSGPEVKATKTVSEVWSSYSTSASASAVFSTTDHITGLEPR